MSNEEIKREIEDTPEAVIEASIGQAKAFLNILIDAIADAEASNLRVGEICQAADAYARVAQVHVMQQQAEALERIATHLSNIHQCLMTPDANREPVTAADQLKRIADATQRRNELLSEYNQRAEASSDKHTEAMNKGIKKMMDAFYGSGTEA